MGATATFTVVVTAEDETTTNTYTVTATRLSGDATLSALTVSTSTDGSDFGGTAAVTPTFTATTTAYTSKPGVDVTHIKVTPTVNQSNATVTVNGASTASGTASAAIALTLGSTTNVNVVVSAQDTQITKTYTLAVTPTLQGPSEVKLTISGSGNSVKEAAGRVTVLATLDDPDTGNTSDPATVDVTVTLTADASSDFPSSQYVLPDPFTIRKGNRVASATISITDDKIDGADERTIAFTGSAGLGRTVTPSTFTLTVEDDDEAGVTVKGTTLDRRRLNVENGSTYTLVLDSKPTHEVTIRADASDATKARFDPIKSFDPTLLVTFTTDNWNTAQTVTVTLYSADAQITHTTTSTDTKYQALTVKTVTVGTPPRPPSSFVGGGGPGGGGGGGDGENEPPTFAETSVTLTVAENTAPGSDVGDPVSATDPDDDEIRYTLEGNNAELFTINTRTGQITVGDGTELDYETEPNIYRLQVTATDPDGSNTSTSVPVTINITNINLPSTTANYDADNNEQITLDELLRAINDYIARRITLDELIFIIRAYLTT